MKRKGQATLEYAVLIAVIAASLLTMANYTKRALQGRIRGTITKISDTPEYTFDQLKLHPHLLISKTAVNKDDLDFRAGTLKKINFAYSPKETEGTTRTTTSLQETANLQDGTVITKNKTNKQMEKTERLVPYDR
ncbi:MAG: hypothetical protein PHT31_05440 [Candidatus Omnitrophica bacterium]|nr:hypothetical protein [Candidatus Omnitrophota bacterium]MDD5653583.1 hypothetical protein [Candidatus Omnitrophota bacterium]